MSALPPKADIEMGAALRLLVTQSGRSLDYADQQVGAETIGFPSLRLAHEADLDTSQFPEIGNEGLVRSV